MNVGGFVRQQQHHQQNEQLLRHPEFSLCRICTHNQDLVVKLLAAYDPADDEFFHESVDDYKQSLETQYPPLCAQCQSRVDLKLRDVTHRVKSQILHAALQKSRKSRGLLDTHYSSVVGLGFLVYSLVWILVISTLVVSIAATLIMHFFGKNE